MFKRYEHRGHVLLQFIPLRIYKFCLLRNPNFCDFSGGGGGPDPLSPPLDPHMTTKGQC